MIKYFKEKVCEDSASAEISTTEIASAMSELAYILEECKNKIDENEITETNPFKNYQHNNQEDDSENLDIEFGGNMPATITEMGELTR